MSDTAKLKDVLEYSVETLPHTKQQVRPPLFVNYSHSSAQHDRVLLRGQRW